MKTSVYQRCVYRYDNYVVWEQQRVDGELQWTRS